MRRIVLVVHNVRSAHNVGSLLRTADGLGVDKVYLTGYTPYPEEKDDERPPHIRRRVSAAIAKTALGAEESAKWKRYPDIQKALERLSAGGFTVAALEQSPQAVELDSYHSDADIALICGSEIGGLSKDVLAAAAVQLQIPMLGAKESFNVSVAAAIALYHLRFLDKSTA